jgi:hypothetical protein
VAAKHYGAHDGSMGNLTDLVEQAPVLTTAAPQPSVEEYVRDADEVEAKDYADPSSTCKPMSSCNTGEAAAWGVTAAGAHMGQLCCWRGIWNLMAQRQAVNHLVNHAVCSQDRAFHTARPTAAARMRLVNTWSNAVNNCTAALLYSSLAVGTPAQEHMMPAAQHHLTTPVSVTPLAGSPVSVASWVHACCCACPAMRQQTLSAPSHPACGWAAAGGGGAAERVEIHSLRTGGLFTTTEPLTNQGQALLAALLNDHDIDLVRGSKLLRRGLLRELKRAYHFRGRPLSTTRLGRMIELACMLRRAAKKRRLAGGWAGVQELLATSRVALPAWALYLGLQIQQARAGQAW